MNYLVFDTETISLEKAFIYNLGYLIVNEKGETLLERNFIIRQIYDNKPLFATAYYANKRPIYTSYMKGKKAIKVDWGKACRTMIKDIKEFDIKSVYAYNGHFDEKAFYFTATFFGNKCRPLDIVKVEDIMDYINPITSTDDYKLFCANNGYMIGNTSRCRRTAQSVYAYLTNNPTYKEEHTALEDSKIEAVILLKALSCQPTTTE